MILNIQDLGALGEFLGSLAVLVTLVYLAFQTRQNTMAIGAQLDAARIGSLLNLNLTAASSSDLQEALVEDRTEEVSVNQARRSAFWAAEFLSLQWTLIQGRSGLLPSFNEPGMALWVRDLFNTYRSLEGWWQANAGFRPEFVKFVEEQRSKAA